MQMRVRLRLGIFLSKWFDFHMKKIICTVVLIGLSTSQHTNAESLAHIAGSSVGAFGAGIGDVVGANMAKNILDNQPQWITVQPKSRAICIKESQGVLNRLYMRCRNGYQEYSRINSQGQKTVLSERPIPAW
jgi:hypothetical protein